MKTQLQSLLAVALVAAAVCAPAQSFLDMADASLDALREEREQNAAPANVRAIFAKAKAAADEDDKLNLCGFYTGMSKAEAQTLAAHYALKDGEWSVNGDPVYEITLSLKGVRRVTKGGNTFDELAQAVANRVGSLKQDRETKVYGLKTIDGLVVEMSESSGFSMFDMDAKAAAELKAWEKRKAAERRAREEREAAERRAWEERQAAERKAKEEARLAAIDWKSESMSIPVSGTVAIDLQSIPGGLWFGKTEVTQAQWKTVGGNDPSRYDNPDNPVEQVSWSDCQWFLEKLNALPAVKKSGLTFRLPTEKEWEYACRAGATGEYCRLADGTEITWATKDQVAWGQFSSGLHPHSVGQKQPNAFGLYDMHGNVWEWTSTANGEAENGEDYYVFRGGCYMDGSCNAFRRDWGVKWHYRDDKVGFRLCAEAKNDKRR